MEAVLTLLAKILENSANAAANSTSVIMFYQPEKPECLKNTEEE